MKVPETRFARSGDVDIAYQQFGSGERDIVMIPGWVSHVELAWELAEYAYFLERLGKMGRVLFFDKRGVGMSDRLDGGTLEERVGDLRAVMDAAGVEHAFIVAWVDGAAAALGLAATDPERVDGLVLGSFIADAAAQLEPSIVDAMTHAVETSWGEGEPASLLAPSLAEDPRFLSWFRRYERQSATPRAAAALQRWGLQIDLRDVLATVPVPTILIHRATAHLMDASSARATAAQIPGARYVEVPGDDLIPYVGDSDAILDEIEEFITGTLEPANHDRVLATALFTDIVGSTEHATKVGDRAWRGLLDSHHHEVRHHLDRFGGREVDTAGDGFFATFDGPARAARCACSIRDAVRQLDLEIRAGIHTGEVEIMGHDVTGIAVHVAARVSALADASEVLVTQTVKDLVLGSGIEFDDRGVHALKGVPDEWRLYVVTAC